jgi:RloB-like protein
MPYPGHLKRRIASRPELKTIVVFTEGQSSEPDYINAPKAIPKIAENYALSVEIHPEHGVPLTLVRSAVDRRRDSEVDECWCIFDVEWPKNHPNLHEATSLARDHEISLAISNPCFEVWLILHIKQFGRWCDTAEAEKRSRDLDGRAGKGLGGAADYMPKRRLAADRAKRLADRHRREGTNFPHDNPSSGMYLFLAALEPEGIGK